MLNKMRRRFILLIMMLVCFGVVIVFSVLVASTRTSLVLQSESRLELLLSKGIVDRTPGSETDGSSVDVQVPYFLVFINDNNEIFLEQNEYYDLDDDLLIKIVSETYKTSESSGELEDYHLRFCREKTAFGIRIAYMDTSIEYSTLRTVVINCVLMGGVAIVLFFFLSLFISKQIIKPISVAWDQQKQFVADASHELKTPLTVIMANAELLTEEQIDITVRSRKRIENIYEESHRMRRLVESLLDQAKADFESDESFELLDFSYLVNESVLTFEPLIFEAGKHIEAHVDGGIFIRGNPDFLKQLLSILLDNAAKYAYLNTAILVELITAGKKTVLLRVSNIGPAISPEEQDKIFTRFYRADPSRQADGSYGLGLSIAKSIAKQHGGEINVESHVEYTAFTVTLPLEKQKNAD